MDMYRVPNDSGVDRPPKLRGPFNEARYSCTRSSVTRLPKEARYFCGPNLARLEVFNLEIFFGGPMLARLE
eukprot:518822-Prorocentrum_minimum.AAC.1